MAATHKPLKWDGMISLRMDAEVLSKLKAIADHYLTSKSAALRRLILDENKKIKREVRNERRNSKTENTGE